MKTRVHALAIAASLTTTTCVGLLPAPAPMRVLERPAHESAPSKCLIVFLPGFGDDETDFIEHGFLEALRSRHLPIDIVSTGATFGYYAKRTLLDRLREDVMRPARAHGYQQIWVVGISMGGMGALLLAKDQTDPLAGIYLIAPYLGDDDLLGEIQHAGGVAHWEPGPPSKDYQREVWRWIKTATATPDASPSIYLGAGDRDKLGYGQSVLRGALPPSRVFRTPGGHDWAPWGILWRDFLDHSDLRARCTP